MADLIRLDEMSSQKVKSEYGFNRLHRYWKEPTSTLWDSIWRDVNNQQYWDLAKRGYLLPDYKKMFLKYLKPGDSVLEAGCGLGQVVISLNKRGFNCSGLDYAPDVINLLNNNFPEIKFDYGDIREMPYKKESFNAYISLGVIEHFQRGQLEMLQEASRCVMKGGYIFLSVPFFNNFRKRKFNFDNLDTLQTEPYFEACLDLLELEWLLENADFKLIDKTFMNPTMTFVQETLFKKIYKYIEDTKKLRSVTDRMLNIVLPKEYLAHMIMVVGKKI